MESKAASGWLRCVQTEEEDVGRTEAVRSNQWAGHDRIHHDPSVLIV